jgi:hypothetical protein
VQNFLSQFYGRSGGERKDYFPNGRDLGAYMGRILDIRWFQPSKNYSNKKLQTFVNEITKAFKIRDLEALTTTDVYASWSAAWSAAWSADLGAAQSAALGAVRGAALGAVRGAAQGAARDAAQSVDLGAARDAARNVALDAAQGAAWSAALSAARGAEYIIVQDLINKKYPKNPFEKLISVYELGLWPAGIFKDKFIIWHPKVVKNS